MVRGRFGGFTVLAFVLQTTAPAFAQLTPFDILDGLMGAAQMQAAREAWTRLPAADRHCLQRALASRNTDVEALASRARVS